MSILETLNLDPQKMLTTSEAADLTGMNPMTIRRAITDGTIHAFTPPSGKKYIFQAKELENLLIPVRPAA
ncbi:MULTISPECIES: helix-turn-helix domain-containing protein [Corynebacterium]|uniref:Helix-turn-helix domain-containing protein n=2 Tax=Corynebacterium TaxID=1716 RepID=A0AAP6XPQ5_9CORY|nr:helix-turn-helix domain-containing protein [Corynebacterium coyleae]